MATRQRDSGRPMMMMTTRSSRLYVLLLLGLVVSTTQAWMMPSSVSFTQQRRQYTRTVNTRLYDLEESQSSIQDRMPFVRAIQDSFYVNSTPQRRDRDNGMVYDLPLWRMDWTEVPGRTNVLNIHDAVYTNMFESLLHTQPPWYFGHLHLADNDDKSHPLQNWKAQSNATNAAVLGTLMRITDFRRMEDGKLLLLVQAMERFVVSHVMQRLPYNTAHVQILPDVDEVDNNNWIKSHTEGQVHEARALAIADSFDRWHRYEMEHTLLPLPLQADLPNEHVVGSTLAKVLPYVPFSLLDAQNVAQSEISCTKAAAIAVQERPAPQSELEIDPYQNLFFEQARAASFATRTLEAQLLDLGVLQEPWLDDKYADMSNLQLEGMIWLHLNEHLKTTQTPVSPVLLGLLPPDMKWPQSFHLAHIGDALELETQREHKYVRVSAHYPALRRQKKLTYAVAALLEQNSHNVAGLRQKLLAIPSTRSRLAYVLQAMDMEWDRGAAFQ